MGVISAGFLLFMLATSNPFVRLAPVPRAGADLNHFGLIVHPPMLYIGYVGFSVAFAIAALFNDSMAMAPGRTLSSATGLVAGTRSARGGEATPHPGDLEGQSAPIGPQTPQPVEVRIGRVVGAP
jgi:hypothetical protein